MSRCELSVGSHCELLFPFSTALRCGIYGMQAIDRSEQATLPSKRTKNIIDYLTYEIYLYIQRGLFERHKLLFALMLTNKLLLSAGVTKASDIDVFLKGGGALDIMSVRKKPKDWIPDNVWLNVIALSQMDSFRDIPDSVFRNDSLWKQWCVPMYSCAPRYNLIFVISCKSVLLDAGMIKRHPRWPKCQSMRTGYPSLNVCVL
jgi:hypothetical protein